VTDSWKQQKKIRRTLFWATLGTFAFALFAFLGGYWLGGVNVVQSQLSQVQDEPNAYCVYAPELLDPEPVFGSEKHAQTKYVACQITGMTEFEAIEFAEAAGLVTRFASIDGEYFMLTEDFTDSRLNLHVLAGIVVRVEAW
jgi:hypothetical protein